MSAHACCLPRRWVEGGRRQGAGQRSQKAHFHSFPAFSSRGVLLPPHGDVLALGGGNPGRRRRGELYRAYSRGPARRDGRAGLREIGGRSENEDHETVSPGGGLRGRLRRCGRFRQTAGPARSRGNFELRTADREANSLTAAFFPAWGGSSVHFLRAAVRHRFSVFRQELDQIRIRLPEGFQLDNGENPGNLDFGPTGSYQLRLAVSKPGPELVVERELVLGRRGVVNFPVAAYPQIKAAFEAAHTRTK